jgi:hypothetical protein
MRDDMFFVTAVTARAPLLGSRALTLIRRGAGTLAICGIILGASLLAQGQEAAPGGRARQAPTVAPLFLKVAWVQPQSQADTSKRYTPVQENIADSNVEIKLYGAAKEVLTTGTPGSDVTPYGVWSGTATAPFAITFRQKNSYVDLTGLANIRAFTKTSGFHVVRPVVKLADGTMLVGDLAISSVPMVALSEFSLTNVRWIKLDPEKVVTLNGGAGTANPNNEIWVPNPDLSKVDEIGFADLMPGSGHGTGGYIQLGGIEVYGKAVPRDAASSKAR